MTDNSTPLDLEKDAAFHTSVIASLPVDARRAEKDKALELLNRKGPAAIDPTSPEARAVLRKIDLHVLPLCFAIYLLQIVDKNSLSFSNIMGVRTDANLSGSQYSWLGSIVYFGYLAGEIPTQFTLHRISVTKWLAYLTIIWGIIVACHGACTNFAGFAVVRFLLGAVEVITAPAVIQLTSAWYTKEEQIARIAVWYSGASIAQIVGGFLAWCLYHADRFRWQGFFILLGLITVVFGLLTFFFLSPSPTEASWLCEEEKIIALERLRSTKVGTEVWGFNKSQVKEAFMDIRLYIIFMLLITTGLPSGGITAFGPEIIRNFGFSTANTTLLSMVPGTVETLGMVLAVWVAKKTCRGFAGVYCLLLATIGVLMMLYVPAHIYGVRYLGYIIMYQFPICIIFLIAWMTSGIAGTTKKFVFSCAYQLGYAVGNIVGPQTYRSYDAPNYYIAKYVMLGMILGSAILFASITMIHWRWNKQREAQDAEDARNGIVHEEIENETFLDLTDFQQRKFRYPL